jgi:uncharacterized protein (DUF2062 family)
VKKWLKRIMPARRTILENRHLSVFGRLLHDPNLWHLNRRSASGAVAVGLFVMYLPPVGQMLIAAGAAIALRVNLPISVALVWITNPVTIPAMYYFSYRVGCWLLGTPAEHLGVEFWTDWHHWLAAVAPLTVGSLACGIVCSAIGYLTVQSLWRWNLAREIRKRKERYRAMAESRLSEPSSKRQI